MLTIKITTAKARSVPVDMGSRMENVVQIEATVWAGKLEMPVSTGLTKEEMEIWQSLDKAVAARLEKELRA